MRILLVEDNVDIASSVGEFLENRAHTVDFAGDGVTGLHLAVTNPYDAIVLDLGLPGIDGIDLLRRLRADARRATPVLVLTARDQLADKLQGLESGADDYVVKPFDMEELDARLRALFRRASERQVPRTLQVGDLVLDEATLRATRAGRPLHLGPIPLRILALLMREQHRVVKRSEIEAEIWGDDPPASDALRTHIATLRNEVDRPFARPLIQTTPRVGYRVNDDHEDD